MNVLGLDVSTATIGYCVVDSSTKKIVKLGHVRLDKQGDLFSKADFAEKEILKIISSNFVTKCYIEEPVQRFTMGMSSAHTIITLSSFNTLVSYLIRRAIGGNNISHVKPNEARKACGITLTTREKSGGLSQKEQTMQQLIAPDGLLSDVKFAFTKTGKHKPQNYDEADAFVVAFFGALRS